MTKDKLLNLREKINFVDDQIMDLLAVRSKIVFDIGNYKKDEEKIVDIEREEKILKRLLSNSRSNYSKDTIVRIWRELFQASTKLQRNKNNIIETKRSIDNINIYQGGKSDLNGNTNIIKLSSNENSHGPSRKLLDFSKLKSNLNRYPEISGITLRKSIGRLFNIESNRIILGSGSDEILLFVALAFCKDGDEIIHAKYGFEMYPILAKIVGATSITIKEDDDFNISVPSIIDKISDSTKIIYLANPNNPTGTYIKRSDIVNLLKNIPKNIILVLDGAYAEYVTKNDYDKGFSLVDEFENVVITRTFSKVYGLASIRMGWCYASKKVASILNKVKGPFNTTALSQQIALIALKDQDHINTIIDSNIQIKNWFEEELKKLKIYTKESHGNFSFIETTTSNAKKITNHLMKNGILIRQLDSYHLPNCLRISIGTKKEMEIVINSLKQL